MMYPSIRIEGSILSPDIVDRLEEMAGQRPADFGLDSGAKVKDEIARTWADAQDYWRIFRRKLEGLREGDLATSETRGQWIVPLLGLLRYDLEYRSASTDVDGKSFSISHWATNRAHTPIQISGYRDPAGIDRKPARPKPQISAHGVVQEYLNLTEQLYGLATNGRVLRLLRDSSRLIKQSYIEFDLERMFNDGLFADFAVMFRLIHATRLPASADTASESIIERLHQDSLDSGARIREGLSKAVEGAIVGFGNGFITHPANGALRERLRAGGLAPGHFYSHLLRLIYRVLFLMVIEERGLVFPAGATQRQREMYSRWYSVQRLREMSEKRYLADRRQSDLWVALRSTFALFAADGPGQRMGLKPLAGDLFSADAIGELAGAELTNESLLNCLRSLGLYEHPDTGQVIRVNYAALNVEEFGSVYEGLLEYEPAVDCSSQTPTFGFTAGDERSRTGSHYTPDDLVQPLIKHSLDHLIAERLKAPDPERALLDLRVGDIACGSGHILLAAARRIATELAVVRTGEEQPSPVAFRGALRDVIRTCIYGVDLNPLAVELCKVALWLEAHNPGEPLNFLDHHIKCGNSIVGFVKREEVDNGVPDEAFARLPGDDAEIGKAVRARNKRERAERNQARIPFTPARKGEIDAVVEQWSAITSLPERTPAEIAVKKQLFEEFSDSGAAWTLKRLASIPISQFYIPRTTGNESKLTTDAEFREIWAGNASAQGEAAATAFAVAERKRFFHWFIEFPEIVGRGGFDCILGNPPYLGDKKLSGTYGHPFCAYLRVAFHPTGLSDLIVYFLRRGYQLIRPAGFFALITTNSIKDGDTRRDGLERLISGGANIAFAARAIRWPGRANLVVSQLSIRHGGLTSTPLLDGTRVSCINAFLCDFATDSAPLVLTENRRSVFNGTHFLGDGFLVTHDEAARWIAEDATNKDVLFPVSNGREINSQPDQSPQRSIISFQDWPLERARQYRKPFETAERLVKPFRATQNRERNRLVWWQYAENRPGLTAALARLSFCFVTSRVTKHLNFSRVSTARVLLNTLHVLTSDRWDLYAVVQSTVHEVWGRHYSMSLKQDLQYSPSDCFDTFAFPPGLWQTPAPALAEIGERYHEHRRALMLRLWLGLTDVYNLFHSKTLEADLEKHFAQRTKKDPLGLAIPEEHRSGALKFTRDEALAGVLELRRLHVELDSAVLAAYGWHQAGPDGPAVALSHDFYDVETLPENDRTRFTISPASRKELLARLLKENHRRAAAEAAGAPPKKAKGAAEQETDDLFAGG